MSSIAVGRIDFINTAPIYYGADTGRVRLPGRTVRAAPAELNRMLARREIQVSAISSIAYAKNYPAWLLLPDLSISARGPVRSVLLCAKQPIGKGARIRVGLTTKSATSRALARILLERDFEARASFEDVDLAPGIPEDFDCLLIIGDDALRLDFRRVYPRVLDLGEYWLDATGLPFVFGLWAVDRAFAETHVLETAQAAAGLYASKNMGKRDIPGAARLAARRTGVSEEVCLDYLRHIEFDLEEDHLAGLLAFYKLLVEHGEIAPEVELVFWRPPGREELLGA